MVCCVPFSCLEIITSSCCSMQGVSWSTMLSYSMGDFYIDLLFVCFHLFITEEYTWMEIIWACTEDKRTKRITGTMTPTLEARFSGRIPTNLWTCCIMTLLNHSPMCLGLDGDGYYSGRHGMWWWHKCKVLVIWETSFIIVNIVKDLQTAF